MLIDLRKVVEVRCVTEVGYGTLERTVKSKVVTPHNSSPFLFVSLTAAELPMLSTGRGVPLSAACGGEVVLYKKAGWLLDTSPTATKMMALLYRSRVKVSNRTPLGLEAVEVSSFRPGWNEGIAWRAFQ